MPKSMSAAIGTLDFSFEHSLVKIIANRNCPEIELAGLSIGPFEEGNEYDVYYWIASELDRSGIVRLREVDQLNVTRLNKLHWTERVQAIGQMSKMPEAFYPKLRRFLADLKRGSANSPERMLDCEKAKQLTQDLVNSRLKKIVSIASAPAQTEQTLKNLTREERFLYDKLFALINEWRTQIIEYREDQE